MSSHRYSRFYFIPAVRELARMVYRKGARAPLSHGFSFFYFFVICTKKHHYFISVGVLISIKKKITVRYEWIFPYDPWTSIK